MIQFISMLVGFAIAVIIILVSVALGRLITNISPNPNDTVAENTFIVAGVFLSVLCYWMGRLTQQKIDRQKRQ